MIRKGLIVVAALAFAAGLVRHLPLDWVAGGVVEAADPDAVAVGTVWSGALAHVTGLPPIETDLQGREVRLSATGATRLDGFVSADGARDVVLSLPVASLARFDGRLSGLAGDVRLQVDTLEVEDGECAAASGLAATDVLARNGARWGGWSGPQLSGPITCEGGAVVVDMAGSQSAGGATDAANARFTFRLDGPYTVAFDVTSARPEAAAVLPLFGLEPQGGGRFALSDAGSWR